VLRITKGIHDRLMRGEQPVIYALVETHLGYRAYAAKELGKVFDLLAHILDGSFDLDGSTLLGSESAGVIEKSAKLIDPGSFERTISPQKSEVLAAYQGKQKQHISIQMDNADRYFSRLIAKEPFIGRTLRMYVGFEDESQSTHLRLFTGIISEISVLPVMTIEADER